MRLARLSDGFTLLELILVLLVMSLAVTISLPSLSRGTASFHLKASGRDVLNVFRLAREKAITEQQTMTVTISRQENSVTLADEVGGGARAMGLPNDVTVDGLALAGEEIHEPALTVRFLANGSCEDAAVLLKNSRGAFIRVVTDPITGGARILQGLGGNGS
jgi:prepilin-type N-terminal cleavage/methylation domain-containing protein